MKAFANDEGECWNDNKSFKQRKLWEFWQECKEWNNSTTGKTASNSYFN